MSLIADESNSDSFLTRYSYVDVCLSIVCHRFIVDKENNRSKKILFHE